ncbi:MAG: hypothetical protein JSS86_24315, partial [Cyanobacteria bacterium SZAS LIN-2]|nr:hypothetical protein [Cyanobacteria bacterium SZAS LIN-2]
MSGDDNKRNCGSVFALALLFVLQFCSLTVWAGELSASPVLDSYSKNLNRTEDNSAALYTSAQASEKAGNFSDACGLYLASAWWPSHHAQFANAKPSIDAAVALSPRLSAGERVTLSDVLSQILQDIHETPGYPHYEDKFYLAESLLKVVQLAPGNTASERAGPTIRLAHWKMSTQPRKAQAMLLEILSDLEKSAPRDPKIGEVLDALIAAYESDSQIDFASQCWERRIKFAKIADPSHYADILEHYETWFLIEHKLLARAAQVADELMTVALSPGQSGKPENRQWEKMAESLATYNPALSDKLYDCAYRCYANIPGSNSFTGIAPVAFHWAARLDERGKRTEAIALLQRALAYPRTPQSDPSLVYRGRLVHDCCQYLRAENRLAEADQLEREFNGQMAVLKNKELLAEHAKMEKVLASSSTGSVDKIEVLVTEAYETLDSHNCAEGISRLRQALDLYEKAAPSEPSGKAYFAFDKVLKRLRACDQAELGTKMLWRLIAGHMEKGFDNPLYQPIYHSHSRPIETADWELFPWNHNDHESRNRILDQQNVERLISMARATKNPRNIVFALETANRWAQWQDRKLSRVANLEEIESQWKLIGDQRKCISSAFDTAHELVRQDRFAEAMAKWRAALSLPLDVSSFVPSRGDRSPLPILSESLGEAFRCKGRYDEAREIFVEAFQRAAFKTGVEYEGGKLVQDFEALAWDFSGIKRDFPAAES